MAGTGALAKCVCTVLEVQVESWPPVLVEASVCVCVGAFCSRGWEGQGGPALPALNLEFVQAAPGKTILLQIFS